MCRFIVTLKEMHHKFKKLIKRQIKEATIEKRNCMQNPSQLFKASTPSTTDRNKYD